MVQILKDNGIVAADFDQAKEETATMERLGVPIRMKIDAIIGKNLNGMITSWNKGAERLYGYTEKEMLGKNISIIVPEEHAEELRLMTQKVSKGQNVEHFETDRVKKDGTRLPVLLSISPIKDSDGEIIGASTIAHDITEHRRMEELLVR